MNSSEKLRNLPAILFFLFLMFGGASFFMNAAWGMWESYPLLYLVPALLLAATLLLHSLNRLGAIRTLVFFALSSIVAMVAEHLAIYYQPFGPYEFKMDFGWKLGRLPIAVLLAWSFLIYTGYALSTGWLFLRKKNKPSRQNKKWGLLLFLIISDAFFITSVDLMMDPVQQFEKNWIWKEGGAFFGVPPGNFLGWMAVVAIASLSFRGLEYFYPQLKDQKNDSSFWLPSAVFLLIAFFYLYAAHKYFGWKLAWIGMVSMLPFPGVLLFVWFRRPAEPYKPVSTP